MYMLADVLFFMFDSKNSLRSASSVSRPYNWSISPTLSILRALSIVFFGLGFDISSWWFKLIRVNSVDGLYCSWFRFASNFACFGGVILTSVLLSWPFSDPTDSALFSDGSEIFRWRPRFFVDVVFTANGPGASTDFAKRCDDLVTRVSILKNSFRFLLFLHWTQIAEKYRHENKWKRLCLFVSAARLAPLYGLCCISRLAIDNWKPIHFQFVSNGVRLSLCAVHFATVQFRFCRWNFSGENVN